MLGSFFSVSTLRSVVSVVFLVPSGVSVVRVVVDLLLSTRLSHATRASGSEAKMAAAAQP